MHQIKLLGVFCIWLLASLLSTFKVAPVQADELKPLFHEAFDNGPLEGPVGKAGAKLSVSASGKLDLDRGTLAFFVQQKGEPHIAEWSQLAGANSRRGDGYWGMLMGFTVRREEFLFNLYDIGRYSPPLRVGPYFGAWKAGEWHHLAAVWDRHQGVTIYQDGERVASNWGQYQWEWNLLPETLYVNAPVDEVYTYADALSDAQIAQLAQGKAPTGAPLPSAPEAQTRARDLAQMGWSGESLAALPVIAANKPQQFVFAPIVQGMDARRPIASVFEGLSRHTWPSIVYGASLRGRYLDLYLQPNQTYDRVRVFTHRRFEGRFLRLPENMRHASPPEYSVASVKSGKPENLPEEPQPKDKATLLPIATERAAIWNRKLPAALTDSHLALERTTGRLGSIDFYRAEPMAKVQPSELTSYKFQSATALPDDETGAALLAETPTRYQRPVEATTNKVAAWQLAAPAFGEFQGTTTPPTEAKAWDGVVVTLVAEKLSQPTPVRVQIKEPVYGWRDWLVGDALLQPSGTGRQTFTLFLKGRPVVNMPPLQSPKYLGNNRYAPQADAVPGVPFGIKVEAANPVTWAMGDGGCTVAFHQTEMRQALPLAADAQIQYMREAYSDLMEGHLYSKRRLVVPMMWLAEFAPERPEFRQMYNRVDRPLWFTGVRERVPEYTYDLPKNTTGAPDWAFWQMQVMKEHLRLVDWYIDNAQLEDGEYGGVWNDDTDHVENWFDYALCMDDSDKIKNSLRFFLDNLWNIQLEEGVGKYVQDDLHYYEEGMGTLAMQTLLDYGDPIVFERAMAASSHYDQWMEERNGKWVLKSIFVGSHGAWTERDFNIADKETFGSYPLIPAGYLIWYNRHPAAAKYYKGWTGMKPDGFYSAAAWRAEGRENEAHQEWEKKLLEPLGKSDAFVHNALIDEIGVSDAVKKAHAVEFKEPGPIAHYWGARDTDVHWFRFKTTGDIRWLTESYKRTWEWFQSHDWLNTAAMPSMDRNPLPRWALIRARMGSLAANRGALVRWPLHAISYTKGANDVAALVSENLDTKITARFYPFTDGPHDMQLRVWRLNPGTYQVTLSRDKNDDGIADAGGTLMQKPMEFERGSYLDLTLPPREVSLLSITPIKTHAMNYDRPDPAISPRTVGFVYADHVVVHVHNLGTRPVENLLVRVRDGRSGQVIVNGEQRIARIEAPLDLKPKEKAVEFKNVDANTYGSLIVEIDPDGEVDDLNRYNNRVVLKY
jgi:hypothetical protein